MLQNQHIVYEEDATRYEINVSFVLNKDSDFDYHFVVSIVNFGECFFESDLNFIGEAIYRKSKIFSSTDAVNIQNGIAKHIEGVNVREIRYNKDFGVIELV